jgi:enoyl-[acyl-carrier protein] reductase I
LPRPARHGAELAFTYQATPKKRVEPLAARSAPNSWCLRCHRQGLDRDLRAVGKAWGKLDFLVHAIAFSDKDELSGRYVDTTADNFTKTMFGRSTAAVVAQRAS